MKYISHVDMHKAYCPDTYSLLSRNWMPFRNILLVPQVEFRGVTGPIQFKEGRRMNFKLDLLKLQQNALVKVNNLINIPNSNYVLVKVTNLINLSNSNYASSS